MDKVNKRWRATQAPRARTSDHFRHRRLRERQVIIAGDSPAMALVVRHGGERGRGGCPGRSGWRRETKRRAIGPLPNPFGRRVCILV